MSSGRERKPRPRKPSDEDDDERRRQRRPRRPPDDENGGDDHHRKQHRPRRPVDDDDDDDDERRKQRRPRRGEEDEERRKSRPRRPPGGDDDDEPRKPRPRRPPGDDDDEEPSNNRKPRPRRPPPDDDGDEHRKPRPRRPPPDDDGVEHRQRRPRRPPEEGDEDDRRGRSVRKTRSGEERRSVSANRSGHVRKVRKPRPPEEMDEEELMKRKMRKKKKDMNDSAGTLGSGDDVDDDDNMDDDDIEKAKRKLKKKKGGLDDSAGSLGFTEDVDGEITTPRKSKPKQRPKKPGVISNMPDLESGDLETPRTRKKKVRPPDEASKSSKMSSKEKKLRKKVVSPTSSPRSTSEKPIKNSAASFDVESFIKRQQAKKQQGGEEEDQDGSANSKSTDFDVEDFVKGNKKSSKTSDTTPPRGIDDEQRKEDAKRIADLEAQVDSLNKQMEQQELELAESLGEVAAHEETKRELEQVREQLEQFMGDRENIEERESSSAQIERLTAQLEEQRQQLEEASKRAAAGEETEKELLDIQAQFNAVIDEKDDLLRTLDGAEKEMQNKDNRILSLEKAVESQLDTIEALEEKLEVTEDELFRMEEELNGLERKGLLDVSVHSKDRGARLNGMRQDRLQRADSLRLEKSLSQKLLSTSSHHTSTKSQQSVEDEKLMKDLDSMADEMKRMGDEFLALNTSPTDDTEIEKRKVEIENWEKQLDERERQLNAEREQIELRQMELDELEQELSDKRAGLTRSPSFGESNETDELRRELEEQEQMLEEMREALELEKSKVSRLEASLEARQDSLTRSSSFGESDEAGELRVELEEREQMLEETREALELEKAKVARLEASLEARQDSLIGPSSFGESNEAEELRIELEELEQMLEESREALEFEKAKVARLEATLEARQDDGSRSQNLADSSDDDTRQEIEEKEQEIAQLKEACQRLEDEKIEMIQTQEQEDLQRDEELRRIQQDIHEKLLALQQDNQDLRTQLEETEQKAMKVSGLQKVINLLEDEVRSLRRMDGMDPEQEEVLNQQRAGVARQITALDEENQTLADEITKLKKTHEQSMAEKEELVSELESTLEDTQRKLESASTGGGAFTASLLKEVSELKQKLKAAENGEGGASELAKKLEEKDLLISELNENMMKLKLEMDDHQVDSTAEARVVELEEQLAAVKADFASRASKDTLAKLRDEVKALKETVRDLRKELKSEKQESESKLKKKDEAIGFFQAQMMKMTQDVARLEKKEQRKPGFLKAMGGGVNAELQQKVQDLEEEVDRWKTANMQLEDEIAVLKADKIELKNKLAAVLRGEAINEDEINEDGSMGSYRSSSNHADDVMGSAHNSISSITPNDFNFMSNSSFSGNASASSSMLDPDTASQRAMRTIGGLWNKMKTPQPPGAPRGLYSMRQDD